MNMEDEFIINSDFIKYNVNSINEINLRNLEVVNKNKQLGLIEIEIEQFNEDISLIYNIRGYKTLRDYLLNPLSKEKAYSLLKSINNSYSMQSYILDTGIVSLKTNFIYIKEINNIPYCYFIYIPNTSKYSKNEEDLKKLIFAVIISIEDNDLRSEALALYSKDKLEDVIKLLKVEGLNFVKQEEIIESVKEPSINEVFKEEEGTTTEVREEETTLIDDFYEETTLIEEELDSSVKVTGKLLINNNGVLSEEHLYKSSTILGRSQSCDVIIDNRVISKKHAEILNEGSSFYVRDIGSKNGTFINGRKLKLMEKVELKSKDKIKLGNVYCSFER